MPAAEICFRVISKDLTIPVYLIDDGTRCAALLAFFFASWPIRDDEELPGLRARDL